MKKYLFFITIVLFIAFSECNADNGSGKDTGLNTRPSSGVVVLTNEVFKKTIFNYELNKEWKYEGKKPAIIDFYADWCGPCRQISPLVEEFAKEYSGKIDVYKVDTDKESILAQNLGITSLPTLLFIPLEGKPQITIGVLPKENLEKIVKDLLLKN